MGREGEREREREREVIRDSGSVSGKWGNREVGDQYFEDAI
jgi:hypothetical protein